MFLSTPPSRVATTMDVLAIEGEEVSIHATLAGGDNTKAGVIMGILKFLSTPPSRVATPEVGQTVNCTMFLSTPPSRVATVCGITIFPGKRVSIHATLAGGDMAISDMADNWNGSIHATPAGGGRQRRVRPSSRVCFDPRKPRGGRPGVQRDGPPQQQVSIHATPAGGDFNFLSPPSFRRMFLSTPPPRVATGQGRDLFLVHFVSIHATLAGGDAQNGPPEGFAKWFLSTPPSRVATMSMA